MTDKIVRVVFYLSTVYLFIMSFTFFTDNVNTVQVDEKEIEPYRLTRRDDAKYSAEIRIFRKFTMCSAVVISDIYALSAAHCATNTFGFMVDEPILVLSKNNLYSGVKAKFIAIEKYRDVALLKGDFKEFNTRVPNFNYSIGDSYSLYTACGFPGNSDFHCATLKFVKNNFSKYEMSGEPIFQGMSGGPVYDVLNGYIIGVNSAISKDNVIIGPLVGLVDEWGI